MKNLVIKIIAGLAYVAMVAVNFMANSLPINNRSTGEISEAYSNLFAPAGLTFSIWGLIYLLLAGFVVYQFLGKSQKAEVVIKRINPLFITTSIANIAWIFAWHYDYIGLSVLIMAVLLFSLIKIADILREEQFTPLNKAANEIGSNKSVAVGGPKPLTNDAYLMGFTAIEKLFIRAPFSVYFGWITVATIANITVFLVSIGWGGFGIADFIWTIIILLVGALIGILRTLYDKNIAYGAVFIWAYLGILLKHISADGFDGQYPGIIATVVICLLLFVFFVGKVIYKNRSRAFRGMASK